MSSQDWNISLLVFPNITQQIYTIFVHDDLLYLGGSFQYGDYFNMAKYNLNTSSFEWMQAIQPGPINDVIGMPEVMEMEGIIYVGGTVDAAGQLTEVHGIAGKKINHFNP